MSQARRGERGFSADLALSALVGCGVSRSCSFGGRSVEREKQALDDRAQSKETVEGRGERERERDEQPGQTRHVHDRPCCYSSHTHQKEWDEGGRRKKGGGR